MSNRPRSNIDEIIVHCSATHDDWMAGKSVFAKRDEIRRWHIEQRKWKDIGYARVIDRDGSIAPGRDLDKDGDTFDEIGAHVSGRNARSVGVCLIGGATSSATDPFEKNFTPEQDAALRATIEEIRAYAGKAALPVRGHNEFANKACPGFNVKRWFEGMPPRKLAQSTTVQATGAAAVATATGGVTAIGALDGNAQLLVVGCVVVVSLALLWILRERIRKWAAGEH